MPETVDNDLVSPITKLVVLLPDPSLIKTPLIPFTEFIMSKFAIEELKVPIKFIEPVANNEPVNGFEITPDNVEPSPK